MAKEITEDSITRKRIGNISTDQLEYTAEKLFTYGTLSLAAIAIYAAVVYGGASIIYAGTKKLRE